MKSDNPRTRPHPLWMWIVATVIAVPVLYVMSVGPAYWISSRITNNSLRMVCFVYRPLFTVSDRLLGDRDEPLYRYAEFGLPKPLALARPSDRDGLPSQFLRVDPVAR